MREIILQFKVFSFFDFGKWHTERLPSLRLNRSISHSCRFDPVDTGVTNKIGMRATKFMATLMQIPRVSARLSRRGVRIE